MDTCVGDDIVEADALPDRGLLQVVPRLKRCTVVQRTCP